MIQKIAVVAIHVRYVMNDEVIDNLDAIIVNLKEVRQLMIEMNEEMQKGLL